MHTTVKRVEKRKLKEVVIENEKKAKKAPTKAELMVQFEALQKDHKALQKEHEALTKENKQNLEIIETMKVTALEKEKEEQVKDDQSMENEMEESYKCKLCDFEADDVYELDAHWFSTRCGDSLLHCHYCDRNYLTKGDLMKHRKQNHPEKVNVCIHFFGGGCDHGEDTCWYSHKSTSSSGAIELPEFKCNNCDKVFVNKFEYMHHRKQDHKESVPQCKKGMGGTCWFGPKNCWFQHEERQISNENGNNKEEMNEAIMNTNQEVIEKIFDMMEKFTKRILLIEKKI